LPSPKKRGKEKNKGGEEKKRSGSFLTKEVA